MCYNFRSDPETVFRFNHYQDEIYESVVQSTDPEKTGIRIIFHVFPGLDVHHTKEC